MVGILTPVSSPGLAEVAKEVKARLKKVVEGL